jgi:hypothetical protein
MTPTAKQNLWNAILKLINKPYIGSGYEAYNDVKNPALRGGLYNWKYRDMRDLYEQLVKYCELAESEIAPWRVLQKYKTKIYPAYLRKIYQALDCVPPVPCPAIGDSWHGGTVFFIDGNDYYVASSIDFDNGNFVACSNPGTLMGTQNQITESYNNTILLAGVPCGPGNLAAEVLLPITENGYNDWFIPSIDALQLINDLGLGLLDPQLYWTSTEADPDNMVIYDVRFGGAQIWPKEVRGPWVKLIRKEICI